MKPEYKPGSRQLNTAWLGEGISVSLGDFWGLGSGGIQAIEFKKRTPILSLCQKILFEKKILHIVIYHGKIEESPVFEVFCPGRAHYFERIKRGWLLDGYPERLVLGEEIWPSLQEAFLPQRDGIWVHAILPGNLPRGLLPGQCFSHRDP